MSCPVALLQRHLLGAAERGDGAALLPLLFLSRRQSLIPQPLGHFSAVRLISDWLFSTWRACFLAQSRLETPTCPV